MVLTNESIRTMISIIDRNTGARLNIKMSSYQYTDPHVKIRRSDDRLIFNMGIPIPGNTVF